MAMAGDVFECALGMVQKEVQIQYPSRWFPPPTNTQTAILDFLF